MRLNRTIRRGCGPVGVVMIIYYVLSSLILLRNRPFGSESQPTAYYGYGTVSAISQCGPGGCSVPTQGYSAPQGPFTGWVIPAYANQPWEYRVNSQTVGTVSPDGTVTGFASGLPGSWPSNMPQGVQMRAAQFGQGGQTGQQRPTGDLPPSGQPVIGQTDKPTGVNPDKVAEDKARIPGGVSINGHPETEALVRNRLSDSAKSQGFHDFGDSYRFVAVGTESERKALVNAAKPFADASNGKLIVQDYDFGDWQATAHKNWVAGIPGKKPPLPDYEPGKPFALLERPKGGVPAVMYNASEVMTVMKQHRPEYPPEAPDPAKVRAFAKASDDWMIWASCGFVALMGLIGAVTSKPQG